MKRRTKIVCTLGPSTASRERIQELIEAGMNVARINCGHGSWDQRAEWVKWVRELSSDLAPVAVLVDLSGPKFRLAEIPGGEIQLDTDSQITLGSSAVKDVILPIDQEEILRSLEPGDRILLGDGEIEVQVTEKTKEGFRARVLCGGAVKSRKGITVVGKVFDVPSMTEKDMADLAEAVKVSPDYIALSYVRDVSDLRVLRREIEKHDPSIRICAKIETRAALSNIDEILKAADLIMVARGDLGLQMRIEEVPAAQKEIIQKCQDAGRPVITATQMLESMMHAGRPTRAEATDVVNAVLDGSDAVMLSGETAAGEFPIEAVQTISRLAETAEGLYDCSRIENLYLDRGAGRISQTEAVAHSAAELASELNAQAIITTTASGETARFVSKFRPEKPIYCVAWNERVRAQMAVVWGVEALCLPLYKTIDECIDQSIDAFLRSKSLKVGEMVVITAGVPAGKAGHTNMILAEMVE